jgi:lipopolysaccharide/colanic/teichoic acid biosynthesis glycosyltransferase
MTGSARRAHSPRPWFARSGETAVACGLIVLLLPVMIAIAIAVKCDSRGPALLWEQRVSPRGRQFWALKFRYTVHELSAYQHREPEPTFVGSIIHTLRLDTLPQLVNVLRGEMTCLLGDADRLFFLD